jgi:luciferase family oxidoreductase group 1
LKLSILDQSPANGTETPTEAFQHTIELAQKAEEWGYHRFWVAEHHGSSRVMGSSPEVLISHLLAKTSRIRVGSGGVMLQHYSPYKVAENFNVLASLAPGRVDLGIGGGPGGMPGTTRALQQDLSPEAAPVAEKLAELIQFLHNQLDESNPHFGLRASPAPHQPADLYVLGTTPSSAETAAKLGLPYVYALFLNNDDTVMTEAVGTYRKLFDTSRGGAPQTMLALPVIAADSDDEAEEYASQIKLVRIYTESGRTLTVFSVEAAEDFCKQSEEDCTFQVQEGNVIHGAQGRVGEQLAEMQRRYNVDELIIQTVIPDFKKRLHSYELLSGVLENARV